MPRRDWITPKHGERTTHRDAATGECPSHTLKAYESDLQTDPNQCKITGVVVTNKKQSQLARKHCQSSSWFVGEASTLQRMSSLCEQVRISGDLLLVVLMHGHVFGGQIKRPRATPRRRCCLGRYRLFNSVKHELQIESRIKPRGLYRTLCCECIQLSTGAPDHNMGSKETLSPRQSYPWFEILLART